MSTHGSPWSIPACAGEPRRYGRNRWPGRVYPRVCGGTAIAAWAYEHAGGLSPRVRGNPGGHEITGLCQRSIPACAGEPRYVAPGAGGNAVYPRVCGGTRRLPPPHRCPRGLSPRVRGNRWHGRPGHHPKRSIPACAGEPEAYAGFGVQGRVYPRVCGGTLADSRRGRGNGGLSPRVRGNRNVVSVAAGAYRSIPACAGEPPCACRCTHPPGVYPRVCGGTVRVTAVTGVLVGLSPRVRGNPASAPDWSRPGRSIPACAGEPWQLLRPAGRCRVYPRVCGGTPFR